jgi:hypothetical protein
MLILSEIVEGKFAYQASTTQPQELGHPSIPFVYQDRDGHPR